MCNKEYVIEVCLCKNNTYKPHWKVRHHDHLTGKYISTNCNLELKLPGFVPVILHNLLGYDAHLFIKSLNYDTKQIDLLPNSKKTNITVVSLNKITLTAIFWQSGNYCFSSYIDKFIVNKSFERRVYKYSAIYKYEETRCHSTIWKDILKLKRNKQKIVLQQRGMCF